MAAVSGDGAAGGGAAGRGTSVRRERRPRHLPRRCGRHLVGAAVRPAGGDDGARHGREPDPAIHRASAVDPRGDPRRRRPGRGQWGVESGIGRVGRAG